jgi:hypothetical protein
MEKLIEMTLLDSRRILLYEPGSVNVPGRRPPDMPIRQTDEGLRFLQNNAPR